MRPILVAASLLILAAPALAFLQYGNGRLDRLLDAGGDSPTVVRVEIRGVAVRATLTMAGPQRHVALVVREVLLGDAGLRGAERLFDITSFAWPEALVPLAVGERPVVILDDDGKRIRCVARCERDRVGRQKDEAAVRRLLVEEAIAALGRTGAPARRLALVRSLAPALEPRAAERLRPVVGSDSGDVWVRRAALGAVLGATRDPALLRAAESDLRGGLRLFRRGDLIVHPDGAKWSAFVFVFQPYEHFLQVGWSTEGDRAAAAFLSLFRAIEEETRGRARIPSWRWRYAIQPLARIGGEPDLRVLWDAYGEWAENGEDRRGHRRDEILRGLGRILEIDLTGATADEQRRRIGAALHERGVLTR